MMPNNITDLERQLVEAEEELASLKKLYNDLAENHAKQVIEIGELQKQSADQDIIILTLESELLKAKERFCQCNENDKTGSTSAMHCNHCGKIEQSETWLK